MWIIIHDNLRWADLLDVGIVATVVYFILRWLSARSSRGILAATLIGGACYALTVWLDLYLTRTLFQAGFIFLLLSIVVILQQDIRRGFERLATFKLGRRKPETDFNQEVMHELQRAVTIMSAERTGALLVFPGQELPDRFTHGGIRVDGCVSSTLLQSIFSPQSPGHDGAVIIRDTRIEQIGIHLPLSTNLDATAASGTRHAAALGLSEHCDSLVVVVSEERGTVSVAQQGRIRIIDPDELEIILTNHEQVHEAIPENESDYREISQRWLLRFTSLGIAIALWATLAFRVDSIQRNYVVPIEFRKLPEHLVVESPSSDYARLTLSGTERVLSEIDSRALVASFDLSEAQAGQQMQLQTQAGIERLPADLRIVTIEPPQISLRIQARETDQAPKP